jgi:hypothetical protein
MAVLVIDTWSVHAVEAPVRLTLAQPGAFPTHAVPTKAASEVETVM